ncbi:AfsR/SARP family transcriptional regulator [Nocardia terpenica]|uniref:AfsR/SARP family transcriptional regulator n=1 Tax=Nocardia terpenica TaxID=455432 RepID=UPI001895A0E1|nr:BTAD domain-containing putative transcriptional regulator [Nocardia terpenica]MBF6060433.1 AfsR/SARP family transcriptional regulator [Nocardia terpenica]MBF6103693.1 AfsR/SARP family transcriptional regulator [Nocardia terpenica]MBF6111933.1 AfsR/SARP family transcriptional regulator [Nocardia terpenica]MBF6117914.1 AfsR/SARP family transcriptional regulator [Nocardia terpenica]MBF6155360.1 AfsR/SARP family transcriptional regulator [Nocardia terpenica]
MDRVTFGVLGPVVAWDAAGGVLGLKGPRHRAVLARLLVARRRVVPVSRLVADLWEEPPAGAIGAVRTFVADLRRVLEPDRPKRAPARLLVTEGPGYALHPEPDAVDAWRFEAAVAATLPPEQALTRLEDALHLWRGPSYADVAQEDWVRGERSRLAELRLHAVERLATVRLDLGLPTEAIPDLDAHLTDHPWREEAWRLLALALYRTGRQADSLAVLRRARTTLADQLGLDPSRKLRQLESDILTQAPHLDLPESPARHSGELSPRDPGTFPPRDSGAFPPPGPGAFPPRGPDAFPPRGPDALHPRDSDALPPPDSGTLLAGIHSTAGDPGQKHAGITRGDGAGITRGDGAGITSETNAGITSENDDQTTNETEGRKTSEADTGRTSEADTGATSGTRGGTTGGDSAARGTESVGAEQVWAWAAAAYDRVVGKGAQARLESTVGLLRGLAVTGGRGLEAAREHRGVVIAAAEEIGDAELTARVIGAYDVPAIWTRSDDPGEAERIVAAAERTLIALPDSKSHASARCRLLATIALEMRGTRSPRGPEAARLAEETARRLDDPTLLAFALNGVFMQSCTRAGLAGRRDGIGAELIGLSERHGLSTFEILGHLIRIQARSALGDFATADRHAVAADRLAARHERPLTTVFTDWYRALRLSATGHLAAAETAYRAAATRLDGSGMPGVARGLLPLALLCLSLSDGTRSAQDAADELDPHAEWGPYRPWIEPFLHIRSGTRADARAALRALPEPPADLMYEALCCLEAAVALELDDPTAIARAYARLRPAAGEIAGAGSGLVTLGPVDRWLAALG